MKSIQLQRTQSLLMELIPEGLSALDDAQINSLPITGVDCKNGKYDATVYFDGSDYSKDEIKEIKTKLRKANGRLKTHILAATSWYKCPDFIFEVDKTLDNSKRLEQIFSQISKGRE